MANKNISVTNGIMAVSFTEKKGKALENYEMYTNTIKALEEIGRVATLKIVEAITRVNATQLWKLGNSVKTGLPYTSINEWAIGEFNYSKSHVSEMLTVGKQCCDPETGVVLECLAGYNYTQLLAFTKNPKLLLKVKAGEDIEGLSLATTAKEIKRLGIEDKGGDKDGKNTDSKDDKSEEKPESNEQTSADNGKTENSKTGAPHEARTITFKMADFAEWYNTLTALAEDMDDKVSAACIMDIVNEWSKIIGNPFTEQ